jgi:hypothetical protein
MGAGLMLFAALLWSGAAAAAPPNEKSVTSVSVPDQVACPYMTHARYPFLTCKKDALGNIVFDAPVQKITGLRIPKMSSFIEGPGYWGS